MHLTVFLSGPKTHSSSLSQLNVLNLKLGTDVRGHALNLTPVSLPQDDVWHHEFPLNSLSQCILRQLFLATPLYASSKIYSPLL